MRSLHPPIATAAVALILAAAGCDALAEWDGGGGDNEIVAVCQQFNNALQTGDWPAAHDLLTGRELTRWDLIWRRAMNDNRLVKNRTTEYDTPVVNGERAVVRATGTTEYKHANESTMNRTKLVVVQDITLRKVDGQWRIEAFDQVHVK